MKSSISSESFKRQDVFIAVFDKAYQCQCELLSMLSNFCLSRVVHQTIFRIYHVDLVDFKIYMEKINGIPLKALLRQLEDGDGKGC